VANERQLAEESEDDGEEISGTEINGGKKVGVLRVDGDLETHPKRLREPNISTNTPMVGHLRKTRRIPPRKLIVPTPAQLVPTREKEKRLLRADDEEKAAEEEDLHVRMRVYMRFCAPRDWVGEFQKSNRPGQMSDVTA